jgi:hypothetical protein
MILLFMLFGLIFLISGSIGLFYTNTNLVAWSTMWVFGNLTFGTFVLFGVLILFFIAFFNAELDR